MLANTIASAETVRNIEEAICWAIESCGNAMPIAAGIDTLLHWATGQSGLRAADDWLKKSHPKVSRSIIAPNSLRGAMTLGGMGLAIELQRIWPNMCLNETHPKVLYHAITRRTYPRNGITDVASWLQELTGSKLDKSIKNDHEFDAMLSAWSTREALTQNWQNLALLPPRNGRHIFPVGQVRYYWPLDVPVR